MAPSQGWICRPIKLFRQEAAATGSLRTRAPELFEHRRYDDPPKADVWSLGATVYKAVTGRFPFLDPDEPVPRISHPSERTDFETTLLGRIRFEWDDRLHAALRPYFTEPEYYLIRDFPRFDMLAKWEPEWGYFVSPSGAATPIREHEGIRPLWRETEESARLFAPREVIDDLVKLIGWPSPCRTA